MLFEESVQTVSKKPDLIIIRLEFAKPSGRLFTLQTFVHFTRLQALAGNVTQ